MLLVIGIFKAFLPYRYDLSVRVSVFAKIINRLIKYGE